MKIKNLLAAALALPIILLSGCAKQSEPPKEPAPSEITAAIMAEIEIPSAVEKDKETIGAYYDADIEQIEALSVYICGSGAYPDELAVFKMKSEDQAQNVSNIAQKRLESQIELYRDYTPKEFYKLEGAQVIVKGNYVMLFICSNNARAIEIAEGLF